MASYTPLGIGRTLFLEFALGSLQVVHWPFQARNCQTQWPWPFAKLSSGDSTPLHAAEGSVKRTRQAACL